MLGRTATDSQPLASSYKQQSRRLVSCLRLCFSPHTYALYTPTLGCRDNSEREVHYSRHSKRAFDPGRFYGGSMWNTKHTSEDIAAMYAIAPSGGNLRGGGGHRAISRSVA